MSFYHEEDPIYLVDGWGYIQVPNGAEAPVDHSTQQQRQPIAGYASDTPDDHIDPALMVDDDGRYEALAPEGLGNFEGQQQQQQQQQPEHIAYPVDIIDFSNDEDEINQFYLAHIGEEQMQLQTQPILENMYAPVTNTGDFYQAPVQMPPQPSPENAYLPVTNTGNFCLDPIQMPPQPAYPPVTNTGDFYQTPVQMPPQPSPENAYLPVTNTGNFFLDLVQMPPQPMGQMLPAAPAEPPQIDPSPVISQPQTTATFAPLPAEITVGTRTYPLVPSLMPLKAGFVGVVVNTAGPGEAGVYKVLCRSLRPDHQICQSILANTEPNLGSHMTRVHNPNSTYNARQDRSREFQCDDCGEIRRGFNAHIKHCQDNHGFRGDYRRLLRNEITRRE
ncbi:hypothetical protein GGS20DRAFT_585129 [Poronia punctata]|nr:hypothetical protein GGS20DRAFT_585129 [Poronia punctata]